MSVGRRYSRFHEVFTRRTVSGDGTGLLFIFRISGYLRDGGEARHRAVVVSNMARASIRLRGVTLR